MARRPTHSTRHIAMPWLRDLGLALLGLGASSAAYAAVAELPVGGAAATLLTGAGIVLLELGRDGTRGVNPITVIGAVFGLGGLADAAALLLENTERGSSFFLYASPTHIPTGLLVLYGGLVSLWAGYHWAASRASPRLRLPVVWTEVRESRLVLACLTLYSLRLTLGYQGLLFGLGTVSSLLRFSGPMVAFLLARRGAETRRPSLTHLGMAVAVADAIRAAMFEYLRLNMILPLLAAILGLLVGTRSIRALRRPELATVYVVVLLGFPYFATFGRERSTLGRGTERLSEIGSLQAGAEDAIVGLVARFTTINQVSQVVRLAEEGGLRQGETLDYLLWVWIPRLAWPDKPTIAKGQWFAEEIGQGSQLDSGGFSNSINMTIPGELFLNFGWAGVALGCLVVGVLFHVFWLAAEFWKGGTNPWGNVFGFFMLYCGAVVVVDLQLIVTMTASYLLFLGVSRAARLMQPRRGGGRATRV